MNTTKMTTGNEAMDMFGVQSLEQRDLMAVNPIGSFQVQEQPGEEVLIALLLPAVQKVREAAAGSELGITDGTNEVPADQEVPGAELSITDGTQPDPEGLLLPAVQKVREAAARTTNQLPLDLTDQGPGGNELLLPAVQKVREAAARMEQVPLELDITNEGTGGVLLPAVQKVREAAARIQCSVVDDVFDNDQQIIAILIG